MKAEFIDTAKEGKEERELFLKFSDETYMDGVRLIALSEDEIRALVEMVLQMVVSNRPKNEKTDTGE